MLAERESGRETSGFRYLQKTFSLEDTQGMAQAVNDYGFALIPGVLSQDEIAATRAALDRLRPFGYDGMGKTEHYKCVFNREPIWRDYLDRPGVIELAETLMGEQCHCIGESAWKSYPGHNGWGNHTDKIFMTLPESIFDDPAFQLPVLICTAHYYLDDMTIDLAPTYVIPGSHKSGRSPQKGEEEWQGKTLEPVLCRAGDVLFFRSEVWHTGSENKTQDSIRYLLQVHYSHRDIAQKWSPFPWTFNPEILATSNERQLRLLGKHPQGAYG